MPAIKQKREVFQSCFFPKLRKMKNVHGSNECTMLVTYWQIDYPLRLSTATLIWKIVSFFQFWHSSCPALLDRWI